MLSPVYRLCRSAGITCIRQAACSHKNIYDLRQATCSHKYTRGPRTLALCLTAAVRMTLAIFCRLVSKTLLCRLNQLKSGFTLRQYLTIHVSILDHIRHLNFDLSGSFKSNESATGFPIYGFLLTIFSN